MRVTLNGKEMRCENFATLQPGAVFQSIPGGVYIKTNQNQMFNPCTGALEAYQNQTIISYPEAELVLEGYECEHQHDADAVDDDK